MKTSKKVLGLVLATGVSVCSFAQVNLGLQSATQAAVSTAVNTTAITAATNAALQAVQTTAGTAVNKTAQATATTSSAVNTAGKGSVSSHQSVVVSQPGSVNGSADVSASGSTLGDKTDKTVSAATSTAKEVKGTAMNEIKSGAAATKQTAATVKPSAQADATVETRAAASSSNQ